MKTATLLRVGHENIAARWLGLLAIAALLMGAASLKAQSSKTETTVTTLGGGPQSYNPSSSFGSSNSVYGTLESQFHTPSGVAFDGSLDYLYVADRDNNAIRLIDLSASPSETYTFAPYPPLVPTNVISQPVGVAVDALGDVFVLNRGKGTNGTVVEFDYFGDLLATNMTRLTNASAIALDTAGDIYVTASNTVFKITPAGVSNVVVTIPNADAFLQGIVVKKNGSTAGLIAVCDSGRNGIYLINPTTGAVTTNAGFNGAGDGTGNRNQGVLNASAKFFQPSGLAEAGDGSLLVADFGNDRLKVVTAAGITTNLYGVYSNYWWTGTTPTGGSAIRGWSDGAVWQPDGGTGNVQARMPFGVAIGPDGTIYTTEDYYHIIRKVTGANIQPPPLPPPPPPPPPVPVIGTVSFPAPDYLSLLTPVTSFVFNNDVIIAIAGTNGTETLYTSGATGTVPDPTTNSSTARFYQDGLPSGSVSDLGATRYPDMTIKAITVNGDGESSPETSARFKFVVANPTISGNNAAQFTVTDVTTNALMYYTTDGSDPTNDGSGTSIGPISSGTVLSLQVPTGTNLTFKIRGFRANYQPSQIAPVTFTSANFVPNTISFGFASGPGSSHYVASPGQSFLVPVGLSLLSGAPPIYGLQFNLTLTNLGSSVVNPGTIGFVSLLGKPDVPSDGYFETIPPWMFVSDSQPNNDPNAFQYQTDWYQSLQFADTNNEDLLGVGWLEVYGRTNLYDTVSQNLLTYPILRGNDPYPASQSIVGEYSFDIPANANPGDVYQIQIGRPSATTFPGLGANPYGIPVVVAAPANTNLLGPDSVNALKNVTIGQIKYLVGDVYPANWFNAGDFGSSNLVNVDVIRVFDFAAYQIAAPPAKSDLFDAMDSCGNIGALDSNPASPNYGYYTNALTYPYPFTYNIVNFTTYLDIYSNVISGPFSAPASVTVLNYLATYFVDEAYTNFNITLSPTPPYQPISTNIVVTHNPVPIIPGNNSLFSGNDSTINQIAFGDGVLDVCDVYVTFRRSLDTNNLVWFQRFWANGARVAEPNYAPVIESSAAKQPSGGKIQSAGNSLASLISITNKPTVNFTAGDDLRATVGQQISIPVTAAVFGSYSLRVAMLNISVVPLDGSPALTTPISFSPGAALGTPTSGFTTSDGPGNYAAAWLDSTIAGISNNATIGTLTITIPANATSLSAYAVHFDHASGSPNGLATLPKQTLTGLITLSSRTNSTYNDNIPDSWRLRWFGTINNVLSVSNACPSGDGVNNWMKYVAGVDPNTAYDFPSLNPNKPLPSGAAMSIYWPTVSGKQYQILSSASLFPGNWSTNATVTGNGNNMQFDDNSTGAVKFYRVLILP